MNRREFIAAGLATAPTLLSCGRLAAAPKRSEPLALATADTEAHVVAVSLTTGKVHQRLRTVEGPHGIQSGANQIAVVAHTDAGAVSILDGRPITVRKVLRGFSAPRYAAITPDGRHAFVTDSGTGELAVVDLQTAKVVHRTPVGEHARHLTLDPAGRTLWIGLGSSAAELAVVDVRDPLRPRNVRRIRPPFPAHDVGFSPTSRTSPSTPRAPPGRPRSCPPHPARST